MYRCDVIVAVNLNGSNLIELCEMLIILTKRQKRVQRTVKETMREVNANYEYMANNEQFGSNLKTQNEECVLKIKNLQRDILVFASFIRSMPLETQSNNVRCILDIIQKS